MARKTVSIKEKRAEAEAAEAAEKKTKKKKKTAKKKTTRRSRAKQPENQRMKLFWGVFSQSLKRVALYEFNQKKQAEQKAEELSKKTPHFVQKVKEVVTEE